MNEAVKEAAPASAPAADEVGIEEEGADDPGRKARVRGAPSAALRSSSSLSARDRASISVALSLAHALRSTGSVAVSLAHAL